MNVANLKLCRELYELTGWNYNDATGFCYYKDMVAFGKIGGATPAYTLDFLIDKALETGHIHVKIKKSDIGVIITAPPCYHIEAKTPADGVAKLLIRSAKKVVT